MHWLGQLHYGLAVLWLLPATRWRPVALALLCGFVAAQFEFMRFGDWSPIAAYLVFDAAVIATVLLWRSHWSDWAVIGLLPVAWYFYTRPDTRETWLWLYWLNIAQFVIAGPWPQIQRALHSFTHGALYREPDHEVR